MSTKPSFLIIWVFKPDIIEKPGKLTEEEYNTLMAELEKAAEEEATEADYLAALEELGVSE